MRSLDQRGHGVNYVEVENVVNEFPKGMLFGEIALINPLKKTRVLSAMTKTNSVLLWLNQEAFDIMLKEKYKRKNDKLGKFVHNSLPKLKELYSLFTVTQNVHQLFKKSVSTLCCISSFMVVVKRAWGLDSIGRWYIG